jgi:hypothetical protein
MSDAATTIETCRNLRGTTGAVYCRLPDGTVRVPSRDETERFCTTGRQGECPGYQPMPLDGMFVAGRS